MKFKDFALSEELLRALEECGFETPTPIQEQAIPILKSGDKDFVGLAQTGTGKTAAFGLPALSIIDDKKRTPQILVLCPTRELALQITQEIKTFAKYKRSIKFSTLYGGVSIVRQLDELRAGVQFIVGTPGRVLDHIKRKTLKLADISAVVLDEADEMLNMGFFPDLKSILSYTPANKKTWLFSATMPKEVETIANKFMSDPHKITVGSRNSSAQNIEHQYAVVNRIDQYEALQRVINAESHIFGIVFTTTRRKAKEIAQKLQKHGCNSDALHGDLSQGQRDYVMNRFRNGEIDILVATDVAARGIDVDNITHVIHFGMPEDIEQYTHRSGRTARAGKFGVSIALITPSEKYRVAHIERQIQKKLEYIRIPDAQDIKKKQVAEFVQSIEAVVPSQNIEQLAVDAIEALNNVSKEDIIKRLLAQSLKKTKDISTKDLNTSLTSERATFSGSRSGMSSRSRNSDRQPRPSSRYPRLYMTVGSKDGMRRKDIAEFITSNVSIDQSVIGDIDLKHTFSYVTVKDQQIARNIVSVLHEGVVNGRRVRVEIAR